MAYNSTLSLHILLVLLNIFLPWLCHVALRCIVVIAPGERGYKILLIRKIHVAVSTSLTLIAIAAECLLTRGRLVCRPKIFLEDLNNFPLSRLLLNECNKCVSLLINYYRRYRKTIHANQHNPVKWCQKEPKTNFDQ